MGDIGQTCSSLSTKEGVITHIVLFKYKPHITWTDLQSHFDTFLKLPSKCLHPSTNKPYMISMRAGKNQSWEPFSKGMTHGFVLEFASQEDLDYYIVEDPVHLAFSKAAKSLIEDSVVVDIRDSVLFGPSPAKPASKPKTYKGSCHCGAVEWTARLEKAEHVLCHCSTCQKLGGGPYSLNAIISTDDLQIQKGTPKVYTYKGASGKSVHCYYCGNCTSHIYHQQEVLEGKVIVRTILLEGGDSWGVGGEIFREGRLGWV
ncbi:hypothetical protein BDZ45DRAFT_761534 [Acephala macrosclerotiorum]|nr:hypothetical protein BDZ45DRAFT_761534 [Acephala macrosclerotiorum]